ncbi:hypothetical protein [Magnetospirillum sulfuroxidans]|uniref:Lipoprotein n=1 Tax=Magnetospirillum sulfuroxidans TaxID=611300 RepID=A0ABS5I7P1_9PROT|nr:hypothetical protein [Magnetospirillum sulfuroxidans]MBR9970447.1 hypothetical protein [Magnetospirillum sulfuroxidans]
MLRLCLSLLSVIALAGCAVVDLAAHGVKKYEKSKEQPSQGQAIASPAPTAAPRDVAEAEVRPVEAAPPDSAGAIRSQPLD